MFSNSSRLFRVYLIQGIGSIAANLLTVGIFFYTSHTLGFHAKQNLLLSAAMGFIYIFGALSAHPLTHRFGSANTLRAVYAITMVLALIPAIFPTRALVCGCEIAFVYFMTISWPILEHLVSAGQTDAQKLARRITIYNLVWSGVATLVVAAGGTIIELFPPGMFYLPAASCLACLLIAALTRITPDEQTYEAQGVPARPDAALAQQRKVALWLGRISVPAMYVSINALNALMPSIAVLQPFRPAVQTLLASAWYAARWVVFLLLGLATFWQTRPRLLLIAAAGLLLSVLLITLRWTGDLTADLSIMLAGQLLLGVCTGLIYMASLYFGMVLTEGSAASGGYHEALIGVGMMLGPAAGWLSEVARPGELSFAVEAVCVVLGASVIFASITSLRFGARAAGRLHAA